MSRLREADVTLRTLLALSALTVAISCVPQREEPQPVPSPPAAAPAPAPAPSPPPAAADWRDIPLTPGQWAYQNGAALFGPAGAAPLLSVRCDAARREVLLSRAGITTGNVLIVRTSYGSRSLPLSVAAGGASELAARVPASDKMLDELAFTRGRFTVEMQGTAMLVVPAWPEPARVIEDCRG